MKYEIQHNYILEKHFIKKQKITKPKTCKVFFLDFI